MILAIATVNNRVSPVFDCSEHIVIYRMENGVSEKQDEYGIHAASYTEKAVALSNLGVNRLICGAISRELYDILIAHGIAITPWISGTVEEVVQAFCDNSIVDKKFFMPGCAKNRNRCRCHTRSYHIN